VRKGADRTPPPAVDDLHNLVEVGLRHWAGGHGPV
jgi:hypothetical protein